jgi:RNA polymerase sigma-70 factor (ECF subfamily)
MPDPQEPTLGRIDPTTGSRLEESPPSIEFVTLFLAEQRRLHRYIVTVLTRQQDADDLLQETVAVLWRKFDEFERGSSFFSWACKTAYLLVLEHRRRQRRDAIVLDEDVLEHVAAVAASDEPGLHMHVGALEKCLDALAPKDRQLIERCYFAKTRPKDLAAEMNRPEKSIYRSLGRIRRVLIECIRRALASAEHRGGSV